MVSDPLGDLERELLQAARRQVSARALAPAAPRTNDRRRPGSLRRRTRWVLLIAGALLVGGSATAVSLIGSRTGTLSGTLPEASGSPLARDRYVIRFWPSLLAGNVAWCDSLTYTAKHDFAKSAGAGGCPGRPPSATHPFFGGNGGVNVPLQMGEHVFYTFTGPQVASVKIDPPGQTIVPQADPRLGPAFKAIVLIEPATLPPVTTVPPSITAPTRDAKGRANPFVLLTALDRSGRAIPIQHPYDSINLPVRSWRAPHQPPHGACSIAQGPLPGLRMISGSVMPRIEGSPQLEGPAFLPCINVTYQYQHQVLTAAVLLNAQQPGTTPAPLPDATHPPGQPGVLNVTVGWPYGDLSARRDGPAWLAVQGGSLQQRLTALRSLSAGRLSSTARHPQGSRPRDVHGSHRL